MKYILLGELIEFEIKVFEMATSYPIPQFTQYSTYSIYRFSISKQDPISIPIWQNRWLSHCLGLTIEETEELTTKRRIVEASLKSAKAAYLKTVKVGDRVS